MWRCHLAYQLLLESSASCAVVSLSSHMAASSSPPRGDVALDELTAVAGGKATPEAPASPACSPKCAVRADSPKVGDSTVNQDIQRLLDEQKRVREEKKRVANELRNAQRRRRRLKHKARLLSQEDLAQVLALRQDEEEERGRKPKRVKKDVGGGEAERPELTAQVTAVDSQGRVEDPADSE